jgi:hypothetical protein
VARGSRVGSAPDVVACLMVLRQTRPMRVSELGELTGPHRTPHVVRPVKSIGASDVNLTERELKLTVEIVRLQLKKERHVDGQGAPDAGGYVRCLGTRASGAPESATTVSVALGAINTYGGRPWPVAEYTLALVAYVVVLGSPLTHLSLIVIIRSSE